MTAPQISEETLLGSIENILGEARDELHAVDEIAEKRDLTDHEREERRYLRKLVSTTTEVRAGILAGHI